MRNIITFSKPVRTRYDPVADKYWQSIEECWSTNPQHRPLIGRVVHMVRDELDLLHERLYLNSL
jgi:hypothetical protein